MSARMTEPSPENAFQHAHAHLLLATYQQLTGHALLPDTPASQQVGHALYHAPFVLLSHDTAPDPVFTYANLAAQQLFAMPWQEIVGLPSRYSAEPLAREERQRLLDQVAAQGYISDYQGVRIAKGGRRFLIRQAVVWNLHTPEGQLVGQAASFALPVTDVI